MRPAGLRGDCGQWSVVDRTQCRQELWAGAGGPALVGGRRIQTPHVSCSFRPPPQVGTPLAPRGGCLRSRPELRVTHHTRPFIQRGPLERLPESRIPNPESQVFSGLMSSGLALASAEPGRGQRRAPVLGEGAPAGRGLEGGPQASGQWEVWPASWCPQTRPVPIVQLLFLLCALGLTCPPKTLRPAAPK